MSEPIINKSICKTTEDPTPPIIPAPTGKCVICPPNQIIFQGACGLGVPGPRGYTGLEGPRGPAGSNGVPGISGESGEQGEPGDISQATLDFVCDNWYETNQDIRSSGEIYAQNFIIENMGLPVAPIQGEIAFDPASGEFFGWDGSAWDQFGAYGVVGPQGDAGPQGDPGISGEPGEQGPQGDPGISGEPGEAGPQGDQGDQGISGEPGEQGISGEPGDQGIPGGDYMTLDDVCDNWNETDQDIHTSGDLIADETLEARRIELNKNLNYEDIEIVFYFP